MIFDYGGIFVNIVHNETVTALQSLSTKGRAKDLYSKFSQAELFSLYETGQISSEEFILGLKDLLGIDCDNQHIEQAWSKMLKEIPAARVDFLCKITKSKRVFMLSNINEIHERVLALKLRDSGLEHFYQAFEKVYFSHKTGLRKPDARAFKQVLAENGLVAEKTLFMDDTLGHVQAAERLGLKGLHLDPPNSFVCR